MGYSASDMVGTLFKVRERRVESDRIVLLAPCPSLSHFTSLTLEPPKSHHHTRAGVPQPRHDGRGHQAAVHPGAYLRMCINRTHTCTSTHPTNNTRSTPTLHHKSKLTGDWLRAHAHRRRAQLQPPAPRCVLWFALVESVSSVFMPSTHQCDRHHD